MTRSGSWPRSVGILYEGKDGGPGELSRSFASGFREQGCRVDLLDRGSQPDGDHDLVLGYGPSTWEGSLLPYGERLASIPKEKRPFFYWWFIESLPDPRIPLPILKFATRLRMAADRYTIRNRAVAGLLKSIRLYRPLLRGFRFQVLGELREFQSRGLLDGLAVTSASRARLLRRTGFRPVVIPIGYHPDLHGEDLGLERDIDVGFLGFMDTRRRKAILERVRKELEERGISVSIQTNLYGAERTAFLNRTCIILNIFRSPSDYYGLRFLFCAANRTLLVSEPTADSEPFIPGVHLVTAPIEELAETIAKYLHERDRRKAIVREAHELVNRHYTIGSMTGRILDHARAVRDGRA